LSQQRQRGGGGHRTETEEVEQRERWQRVRRPPAPEDTLDGAPQQDRTYVAPPEALVIAASLSSPPGPSRSPPPRWM